ncbi:NAD-dependent dihydropyrimidine dehydrogenase, PreA subunit [Paenibacillus sp. 1_12]|uniref:4Fe-4S dicluster domain-containing protein n=1 Tax=Paenibacillus sp. 1_12 TaxID=1566278 RepID=UPI0008E425B1|nr:ferredoxin family protein [Paenibacillus sp. 1_12]SFK75505.1 NAD-dependent dihydropyrimidine dehydrogenase, PreA subunit [Paenibacillus sp. 1_12]
MIEIISESKCIECNMCVSVCPTNVFDKTANGIPVIARQSDCQTCFMCELYCPADALFVDPNPEPQSKLDEAELERQGVIGGYRAVVGWAVNKKKSVS